MQEHELGQTEERIIIFSPHPDDDVLACGGLISIKGKSRCKLYIVYMTDGRNSHDICFGIKTDPSPQELKNIRRREAVAAAKQLGISNDRLFFLQYEDGRLSANIMNARKEVFYLINRLKPSSIYYPLPEDDHLDHQATAKIIDEVIKDVDFAINQWGYLIWQSTSTNYFNERKLVELDIKAELPLKIKALMCHRSQTQIISKHQTIPILTDSVQSSFLKNFENFWFIKSA